MDKYQNKYRIPSARLKNWDYRNDGAYFITICTDNQQHFFGDVKDKIMHLSDIGKLAHNFWAEIPAHFPFVELGNFVVMPNHTHGILIIDNSLMNDKFKNSLDDALDDKLDAVQTLKCNVSSSDGGDGDPGTRDNSKNQHMANISPKSGSISTIIRSYKSAVSKHARKIHADFGWQTRFHDHIIRNSRSFENIQNYIENNPAKWDNDKFQE